MSLPSSLVSPSDPSADMPRGIWTVRFPAPGVYAHLQGVSSAGHLLFECYPRNEDEVVAMGRDILAALDRYDPVPKEASRALAIVRG